MNSNDYISKDKCLDIIGPYNSDNNINSVISYDNDIFSLVFEYLPLDELSNLSIVSSLFYQAACSRWMRIQSIVFQNKSFSSRIYPASSLSSPLVSTSVNLNAAIRNLYPSPPSPLATATTESRMNVDIIPSMFLPSEATFDTHEPRNDFNFFVSQTTRLLASRYSNILENPNKSNSVRNNNSDFKRIVALHRNIRNNLEEQLRALGEMNSSSFMDNLQNYSYQQLDSGSPSKSNHSVKRKRRELEDNDMTGSAKLEDQSENLNKEDDEKTSYNTSDLEYETEAKKRKAENGSSSMSSDEISPIINSETFIDRDLENRDQMNTMDMISSLDSSQEVSKNNKVPNEFFQTSKEFLYQIKMRINSRRLILDTLNARPWGLERKLFPCLENLKKLTLKACRLDALDLRSALNSLSNTLQSLSLTMCVIEDLNNENGMKYDAPVLLALKDFSLSPASFVWRDKLLVRAPNLQKITSFRKMLEDRCSTCGKPQPSFKCSRCRFFAFCSEECQRKDWMSQNGHKTVCEKPLEISPRFETDPESWLVPTLESCPQIEELCLAHYWKDGFLFGTNFTDSNTKSIEIQNAKKSLKNASIWTRLAPVSSLPSISRTITTETMNDDDDDDLSRNDMQNSSMPLIRDDTPTPIPNSLESLKDQEKARKILPAFSKLSLKLMLKNVKSLTVVRCGLNNSSLETIAENGISLRYLDISYNSKITCTGLGFIKNSRCPYLKSLKLTQCYRLSESSILNLAESLPALEELVCDSGFRRKRTQGHTEGIIPIWGLRVSTLRALGLKLKSLRRIVFLPQPRQENTVENENKSQKIETEELKKVIEEMRLANIEVIESRNEMQ